MAAVQRLIGLVLLLCSQTVFAAYTCSFAGSTGTHPTDSALAYGIMSAAYNARKVPFGAACNPAGSYYQQLQLVSSSPPVFRSKIGPMGSCAGSDEFNVSCSGAPDEVQCSGNKERDPDTNTCECKSIRNAGSFMVTGDHYDGCNGGCAMVLRSGWYDKAANTTWGSWDQNGMACTAGTPSVLTSNDPKVEAAKKCEAGTCPGTVNGQSVCVPCDKGKQTTSSTKSESASETPSGASSPASSGSSSEEESEQTECKDGQCTTNKKTVGVGADGKKTEKNEKTVQPQSKYCEANPKAAVCKGTESSWGGTCDAFTCEGDAVQCAQAKGAWELACTLKTDSSSTVVQTGLQAVAGTLSDAKPVETTASIGQFNTQNPYSGACPQDVTVSVWGKSFGIPLSQTCSWIQAIGWFLVAGATLAGARIAFT